MGKSKGKHFKIWAIALATAFVCAFVPITRQFTPDSNIILPVKNSTHLTTTKNIVPTLFQLSIDQDSSQKSDKEPLIDPVPSNDPGQPQNQPEANPNSTSPTWVQMIGAIVNVFLSLYQNF